MNFTRTQYVSLTTALGIAAIAWYFWPGEQLDPSAEAVFIRSESIENDFIQKCELQLNGRPLTGEKHVLPVNSELHVSGQFEYDREQVAKPEYATGLLIIGYRPKSTAEDAWKMGGENEWVGGQGNGKSEFKVTVTLAPGEYDIRAYVLTNIMGWDKPKVEYVASGEAVVTN